MTFSSSGLILNESCVRWLQLRFKHCINNMLRLVCAACWICKWITFTPAFLLKLFLFFDIFVFYTPSLTLVNSNVGLGNWIVCIFYVHLISVSQMKSSVVSSSHGSVHCKRGMLNSVIVCTTGSIYLFLLQTEQFKNANQYELNVIFFFFNFFFINSQNWDKLKTSEHFTKGKTIFGQCQLLSL